MRKSIKISVNSILITSAVIILLMLSLLGILRIPAIQTYLINGVSGYISDEIKATISVEKVEFNFLNRLALKNVLIMDRHNDTMIFAPKVTAGLRHLGRKNGELRFGRIMVENPVVALITDTTGQMNLTWYLDLLRKKDDTLSSKRTTVSVNTIELTGGRFALINRNSGRSNIPVDFSNLKLDSINCIINRLSVNSDSVSMGISNLEFSESTGLKVRSFRSDFSVIDRSLKFRDINLALDKSNIAAEHLFLIADSTSSFGNFTTDITLDIAFENSCIYSSDLKYFIRFLNSYDEFFWLSGNITGTISELKGRNIRMSYRDETILDMDFDLSGLPDIHNTFIFLELNDFRSISGDIEQFNIPGRGKLLLPDELRELGVVSFSGNFTGFTTDFVTYGRINTNKGVISTDISMRPEGKERFRLKGMLKGSGLDLSGIASKRDLLGSLTFEVNVDGYTEGFKKYYVDLNGRIDSIEINDYIYRNIVLNGSFNDKAWDGDIKIEESNIKLEVLGMLDFGKELPEFDFTLNLRNADLFRLNIDRKDTTAAASLLLTANFTGNNLDNLDGEIKLLNSNFRKYGNKLEIYDFSLRTSSFRNTPSIALRTDFIDASLNGEYSFSGMNILMRKAMAVLIPSKFRMPDLKIAPEANRFNFDVKFKNTDRLNDFLRTGLRIAQNSSISGIVYSDSILLLTGSFSSFSYKNNTFTDLAINGNLADTTAAIDVTTASCDLSGLADLKNLKSRFRMMPDSFILGLDWDNKEKTRYSGKISANGVFDPSGRSEMRPVLKINLEPGEIYIRDKLMTIDAANIISDTTSMKISGFRIGDLQNFISIEGAASDNVNDTLFFRFNGININPLNNLYEKRLKYDPEMLRLSLGGTLNGFISFTDIYRNFMFESDIIIRDFTLLETKYGNIGLRSVWNNDRKVADINVKNDYQGVKMIDIIGTYNPADKNAILKINADKLPLETLNPLLKSFASGITGTATGEVMLTGQPSKPVLTGSLRAENGLFRIDYLQTKYKLNDIIRFDSQGIKFNNIRIQDERNNYATLNGAVFHEYFKNFAVDLTIRPIDFMVLNTREKDNELFYGTAFGSGVTTIKTSGSVLSFDISAKTGRNTRFFIPLNTAMSVSENSFVTFVEPENEEEKNEPGTEPVIKMPEETIMEIKFDLEVTPDAEVQLIMDPTAGDIIKGKGSGNLNIGLDRKGNFSIYGDYIIETGDYLFTLGNIINKSFSVEHGGQITFNGDVDNADINIKAIYKTKASLYDLRPDLLEDKYKERIPVECHLLLTGKLFNPLVGFDIYLPTADEETRTYLNNIIKTEEDMSRQFLFLLVMNSFYSDASTSNTSSSSNLNSGSVVGVTTMEMLSNQLSNWLSQISNDFDIGVVYRPGSSTMPNSQELQVALSTQLLNDRVIINGNFDMAGNSANQTGGTSPSSTNQFTGAFDIEYKINEKIRFKFFNRSNDNFYIDNSTQYTQGIGVFYRQDFNKLKDIFRKPEKTEIKKVKESKEKKNP